MKRNHIFAFALISLIWMGTAAWGGAVHPLVAHSISQSSADDFLSVMVVMKDKVHVNTTLSRCHEKITAMKSYCTLSQQSVTDYLEKQKFFGRVKDYNPFWLFNTVYVKAKPIVIEMLATRSDVETVIFPAKYTIPPIPASDSISPSSSVAGASGSRSRLAQDSSFEENLQLINVPQAWEELANGIPIRGTGITVGVIDTGVEATHPDLNGKILKTGRADENGVVTGGERGSLAPETSGHGTHVTSVIVGGNVGGTYIGVAPDAKAIVVRAFDVVGGELTAGDPQILGGLQWMMEQEVDVINMSFGAGKGEASQVFYSGGNGFNGVVSHIENLGGVMVAAVGNQGPTSSTTESPGNVPQVIGVGSTLKSTSEVSTFSARGPVDWGGIGGINEVVKPDIMAPGGSGDPQNPQDPLSIRGAYLNGTYRTLAGTSQASPHVAGVVALLIQTDPSLTFKGQGNPQSSPTRRERIQNVLYATAIDLGVSGKDNVTGFGLVDAHGAVTSLLGPDTLSPTIEVVSVGTPTFGEPFTVTVKVVDNRVFKPIVQFFYKRDSDGSFTRAGKSPITMQQIDTFTYRAIIPGSEMVENFSYYIEADVGANPSSFEPATGSTGASVASIQPSSVVSSADVIAGPSPYNPSNGNMSFTFRLSQASSVQVYIYGITGNVMQVISHAGSFGYNVVDWNGQTGFGGNIPEGAYVYQIISGGKPIPGGRGKFLVLNN